jgi:hypothetical protein
MTAKRSLGTKEETPAAARFRKAKVQFQILSALLAQIPRLLAPDPIYFVETLAERCSWRSPHSGLVRGKWLRPL